MDHSWRPHPPIQGNNNDNICPTCSISHFPFCPPHPHPSRFPGPNFEPIRSPINMGRPVYHNPPDPYHDSGHWNRNPNFPPQVGEFGTVNCNDSISSSSSRDFYSMQNHGYVGSDYDRSYGNCVNDDSKRLRVDGVNSRSSRREFAGNMAKPLMESGPQLGFGFNGGVRGYAQDRAGFDRSFENQEYGYSNNGGMRGPSSVEMGNGSVGRGVDYRREELDYRSGYESGHLMKRSVSDPGHGRVGNEIQGHNHQVGQYGQVAKPPDLGSFHHGGTGHGGDWQSYGFDHPNYGNNFAPLRSNNAAMQYENRNSMATAKQYSDSHVPLHTSMAQVGQMDYGPGSFGGSRQPLETMPPPVEGYQGPISNQRAPVHPLSGSPMDKHSRFGYSVSEPMGHQRAPQGFDFRPPLPSSPPPPLPREPPPVHWSAEHRPSCSPPRASSSLTPVPGSQSMLTTFGQYSGRSQHLPPKNNLHDKPKTVDAAHLFKPPHRTSRPDHFVIILRGLPGSGKSYIAKMLRDLEMEHGGSAPRIHSMDDYFMTEVEKADENSASKSSARGKKPKGKVVLEYCYEPEMEEAYRSSLLKAFRKTVEEGVFTFVIVDDRNLRVADFAQFWATAKRSGYEAYVLEAPYKDPAGCTARNVHGFSHDDVEKMAAQWEEAPSLYLQLDVKSLFHGDALKESSIQEVDMDTEDGDCDGSLSNVDERKTEKNFAAGKFEHDVSPEEEKDTYEIINRTEVKELGHSKWSDDLDDDDRVGIEVLKGKANSLSTLLGTYGKEGKSVHWGDQGGSSGFSIGAVKKARMTSLVIGPGSGYNMKSNPLVEDDAMTAQSSEKQKHNVFQERLRAERESFKAVFDRRRHRIGGLLEDE